MTANEYKLAIKGIATTGAEFLKQKGSFKVVTSRESLIPSSIMADFHFLRLLPASMLNYVKTSMATFMLII